ncbi:hypothetical protein [Streptomyces sp. NPDC089919]|uniref:hypothetical protein n=1 Tax=Streptomyces sp. NPDC089919 TaxID=3155188 RepID=UPI0034194BCA
MTKTPLTRAIATLALAAAPALGLLAATPAVQNGWGADWPVAMGSGWGQTAPTDTGDRATTASCPGCGPADVIEASGAGRTVRGAAA